MATTIANSSCPSSAEAATTFLLARPVIASSPDAFRSAFAAAIFEEKAAALDPRNARLRISYFLCRLGVQLDGATAAILPIARHELAAALDLSLVRVKRALAMLGLCGAADADTHGIRVTDWQRLCAIARLDPSELHLMVEMDDFSEIPNEEAANRLFTASGEPACFT